MLGYKIALSGRSDPPRWYRASAYKVPDAAGGAELGPAAILDFTRNRYALTGLGEGQIAEASAPELASMKAADFDDLITFSRPSTAGFFTEGNVYSVAAANVARFDSSSGSTRLLAEPASVNYFKNAKFENAVVGGSCPNLTLNGADGVNITIAAKGQEEGLSYIDVKFAGTAAAGLSYPHIRLAASDCPVAAAGQYWTYSAFYKRISGTVPSSLSAVVQERQGANFLNGNSLDISGVSAQRSRFQVGYLTTDANTDNVWPLLRFVTEAGVSYNFTLRLYAPQFEKHQYATSPILSGQNATATRAADQLLLDAKVQALLRRDKSTIVVRYRTLADPDGRDAIRYLMSGRDTGNSRICIRASSPLSSGGPLAVVGNGSAVSVLARPNDIAAKQSVAAAFSLSPSQSRFFVNGVASSGNPGMGFDHASNAATSFYLASSPSASDGEMVLLDALLIYPFEVDAAAMPALTA
ncbi:hypothetical protein [Rhizobium sp. L1K21]|uniref:phage head spike fiber domain-containing protein n=1 Tax=Rhizobium sp. L1K21 TaxID=2954933 RepID=UPI0020932AFA|nr:hypothetical protein [Rhizobium sp. L1K21]MCO6185532.1 hypothetical protein [Rhizobium sp. L1K21]